MATCEISSTGSYISLSFILDLFLLVFFCLNVYHVKSPFFSTIQGICFIFVQPPFPIKSNVMGLNRQPPLELLGEKLSLSRFVGKERFESSIVPTEKKIRFKNSV